VGKLTQMDGLAPEREKNTAYPAANKKAGTQTLVPALVLAGCPDKI
jgi:hypothetical protein